MIPLPIPNHERLGSDDLLDQSHSRPVIEGIVQAFMRRVQSTESVLFDVLRAKQLPLATDAALDIFGSLVGLSREGRDDVSYLAAIRLEVKVNRSNGRLVDIVEIATLANRNRPAIVRETYPARFEAVLYDALSPRITVAYMLRARPAGIPFQVIYSEISETLTNHYSSVYDPTTEPGSEFSSVHTTQSTQLYSSAQNV